LGKDLKDPSEWTMLEMETKTDAGNVMTFPLAYLRGTDVLQVSLDVLLQSSAKLRIGKGKGPVFIIGEYLKGTNNMMRNK
jgi:hypothetical protein